jgi:hypothetical protein
MDDAQELSIGNSVVAEHRFCYPRVTALPRPAAERSGQPLEQPGTGVAAALREAGAGDGLRTW